MKRTHPTSPVESSIGSTFIIALLMLAVLSTVGATVLLSISTRYDYTQKVIGWSEALSAAEAGADFGIANCRRTLPGGTTSPWMGWKKYNGAFVWVPIVDAADAADQLTKGGTLVYDLPPNAHIMQTGEGTNELWYHVEVDAPASLIIGGNQWYRIRSTGYAALPGQPRAGNDSPDGSRNHNELLRKMDLRFDHFIRRYGDYAHAAGSAVAVNPQAARRIEVIARPTTPFDAAVVATATTGAPLSMPLVDSYDSTDTANYPGGLYNSTSRNPTTGVGSKGNVYVNAPISTLNTTVYGSVATNNGTLAKTSNITGQVDNMGTRDTAPVALPAWKASSVSSPTSSLVAGPPSAPVYRSWSSINNLTVTLPSGSSTGVANIYADGDVTGGITVAAGVTLKIWFTGNFSMKARDINNQNQNAAFLQLYGVNPPAGQSRTIDLGSGNPGYRYFVIDAPGHDFSVNGNPDFCGAIIAKTVSGNGNTTWHYDEALGSVGFPVDYKRAFWVEDER